MVKTLEQTAREPLYSQVANKIGQLIEGGVLRAGDRIPSVRRASRQHKVSITTAVQAYLALENRGLIEARTKSGFFVRFQRHYDLGEPKTSRPSGGDVPTESPTLIAKLLDVTMRREVVQLGAGLPNARLLPRAEAQP